MHLKYFSHDQFSAQTRDRVCFFTKDFLARASRTKSNQIAFERLVVVKKFCYWDEDVKNFKLQYIRRYLSLRSVAAVGCQIVNPAPVRTATCSLVCFNLTEHLSKRKNKLPCLEGLFKIKLSPATLKIIPLKLQAKFEKHLTWLLANYSCVNLLSAATTTSINTS